MRDTAEGASCTTSSCALEEAASSLSFLNAPPPEDLRLLPWEGTEDEEIN